MQTFPWSDLYHIDLRWGPRPDDASSCARRLKHYLSLLEPLHTAVCGFFSVYEPTRALFPLPQESDEYMPLWQRRIKETEPELEYFKTGCHLRAHSDFGNSRFLLLYIDAGADDEEHRGHRLPRQFGVNYLGLSTVVKDLQGEDAPIVASLKPMLLASIKAWEPHCASISSNNYVQLKHDPSTLKPYSNGTWAIYLAPQLAAEVTCPSEIEAERVCGGGLLMMAAKGAFSHRIPEQRAKAEAIHAAVAPLGL